jgi:hypothetical protein
MEIQEIQEQLNKAKSNKAKYSALVDNEEHANQREFLRMLIDAYDGEITTLNDMIQNNNLSGGKRTKHRKHRKTSRRRNHKKSTRRRRHRR